MKAALFIVGNLSVLWLAWRWASAIAARRLDFAVGLCALFPICAVLAVLCAGLAGHLRPLPVTLAVCGIAAAVAFGTRHCGGLADFIVLKAPRSIASRVAAGAVVAFASFPVVRAFTAGTGYFIDDFGYHAVAVAAWIQHGGFTQIMPQFMAYLPLNAELLAAWFALPFHHDGLVVLTGLVWLGLAAVAAGGIVRLAGCDATASLLTAAAVLASPPLVWQTRTFSACDLAGSAALLGAIYFAARASGTLRPGHAVVAGLLAGFAAGTKATFLPVAAVVCVSPLLARMPWRSRVTLFAAMCAAAAATGSVWFLRNALASGNPLFPAEIGPFAGPLSRSEQVDITLVGFLAERPWTWRMWGHIAHEYLGWPLPLGVLAVSGYITAFAAEWSGRAPRAPAEGTLRRLLLTGGVVQFALHLVAPFCIGGGYVDGRIEVYSRYVVPWFVFGLALAGPLLDARARFALVWRSLAGVGLALCWPLSGTMRFGGLAAALGCVALLHWLPARAWKPLALLSLATIWPALAALAPRMRAQTEKNFRLHLQTAGGKSLGQALAALESLPPGTRLTRFANHSYLNSPLFGRDWQLRPVFTAPDGQPLPPLHLQFRADPSLRFFAPEAAPPADAREFLANLRAAGISDVFVTKYDAAAWPPQQALIEESGQATRTFDDGDSTLWHFLPPSP